MCQSGTIIEISPRMPSSRNFSTNRTSIVRSCASGGLRFDSASLTLAGLAHTTRGPSSALPTFIPQHIRQDTYHPVHVWLVPLTISIFTSHVENDSIPRLIRQDTCDCLIEAVRVIWCRCHVEPALHLCMWFPYPFLFIKCR